MYIFLRAAFEVSTSFTFRLTSDAHLDKFPPSASTVFTPTEEPVQGNGRAEEKKNWFASPRMSLICMTTSEETRTERQRFEMKIFSAWTKTLSKSSNKCKKCKDDRPLIDLRNPDAAFSYRRLHLLFFLEHQQFDHRPTDRVNKRSLITQANAISSAPCGQTR